ncbi:MAG TPA: hypothetical protein VNM48_07930 [Chloroflexota bacterium]|nr:hypothetical protein [Chloroflexota bacterium]
MSAPLRVCLQGNVAQNAYLLAKGLRALGVEADSFDQQGVGFPMQHPAWEDGADKLLTAMQRAPRGVPAGGVPEEDAEGEQSNRGGATE